MPHIVISSNCQTAGLAATISEIFTRSTIMPLPLPRLANAAEEAQFVEQLVDADVWISLGHFELVEKHQAKLKPGFMLVKAPEIRFAAFHPDLCYARKTSTGELVNPHYNSAIVVWAYRNEIAPEDAARLFNKSTYEALGYLDAWAPSVAHLRQLFINYGMEKDFTNFFWQVKRQGNFMYSINHPRSQALVQMGKVLATRMGHGSDVYQKHIQINDGLNHIIWPHYPELADDLALEGGSYCWKLGHQTRIDGVRNYVDFCYAGYRSQGIEPADLAFAFFDASNVDTVLKSQIKAGR